MKINWKLVAIIATTFAFWAGVAFCGAAAFAEEPAAPTKFGTVQNPYRVYGVLDPGKYYIKTTGGGCLFIRYVGRRDHDGFYDASRDRVAIRSDWGLVAIANGKEVFTGSPDELLRRSVTAPIQAPMPCADLRRTLRSQ